MTTTSPSSPAETSPSSSSYWNGVTLLVALVGVAGSLWLSMGMEPKLKACPLCFYQRSFVMAVAAVLAVGLLARVIRPGLLSLLCLPLVVAGLGVALFHVNLERTGVLECPMGLFDWGTAPRQSLSVYVVLAILVVIDLVGSGALKFNPLPAGSGILLGTLIALGCATSNPPLKDPPAAEYPNKSPDECRRPYVAPAP
jgi:disulfide bond formation protein DsbB